MKSQTFVLVWVYGTQAKEVYRSPLVQLVQLKREQLKKEPAYAKGKLQVRTEGGFKAKPIL